MIEAKTLKEFSDRRQTTMDNIVKEYLQHLFLSFLYREKKSESLLFKGGTALRLVWRSPRFSEDLDFTGSKISISQIETLMEAALGQIENEGIKTDIEESKKTSGGCLAVFHFKTDEYESGIQVEVSLRAEPKDAGVASLVNSDLLPSYTLVHLDEKKLVAEKIQACLTRAKARDFYDLYFILRSRMAFKETFSKDKTLNAKLVKAVESQKLDMKSELKRFLPAGQHLLLKNFKSTLLAEIERNLP
ncbi:MAG: hypothetical protein AUJ71_03240 [Candidatus Omnitrophica bacterium CG1_02_49_16]|nr:MAG: hypothetical protein AUJ71_03240 [Candidatus Omnitrophica bacterium CG1_02_49_16]